MYSSVKTTILIECMSTLFMAGTDIAKDGWFTLVHTPTACEIESTPLMPSLN